MNFFVTGAGGAGNYSIGDTTNTVAGRKFMASKPGFAAIDFTKDSFTLRFIGADTKVLYEYTGRK